MNSAQKAIKYLAIGFAACLTISIVCLILNIIVSIFGAFVPKEDHNVSSVSEENTKEVVDAEEVFDDVENLKIESSIYKVNIQSDPSIDGVKIALYNVSSKYKIYYNENSNTIETAEDNWLSGLFGKKNSQSSGKITIYVSDKIELNKVNIEMGVGSVELSDITMNQLDVENGVGEFKCENVTADRADIEGGVGNVECENVTFNGLEVEGGVGEISINGTLTGKTQLSAGMGNVDVDLNGNKDDYNYKVEMGLGSIYIDGEKYSDSDLYNNNQNNLIDIEGGVGTIRVDFN